LPVGGVELLQIARDALLNLRHAPVHLGAREVLVAIVDRLELAAVNKVHALVRGLGLVRIRGGVTKLRRYPEPGAAHPSLKH
jgi:hypothetical protein